MSSQVELARTLATLLELRDGYTARVVQHVSGHDGRSTRGIRRKAVYDAAKATTAATDALIDAHEALIAAHRKLVR